jgi:hypothetical protein
MTAVPASIRAFTELEQVLRAHHGEGALYVKPMVYVKGADTIVVGGWAFLDGEPAMIPEGLTLLVITHGEPLRTLGRDPDAVLAILGDRVKKHAEPCAHYTVTVRERDKAELLARIDALPEHRPRPARSRSAFDAAPVHAGEAPRDGIGGWVLVGLMVVVILGVIVAMFMR